MMTRKDYVKVSDILREYGEDNPESQSFGTLVAAFADYMQSDNPRFDRHRFIDACFFSERVGA